MKKALQIALVIFVILIIGCSKENEQKRFNKYLDELFLFFLGDDPLDINNTLYYPEKYGLEDAKVEPITLSEEGSIEYYQELESIKATLLSFNNLSIDNILTKQIIIDYIDRELAFKDFYYYDNYLESHLGYQAQLPIVLAEYRFDDFNDILNYFKYLETTQDTFEDLINYEHEKININMGLPDVLINRTIAQCQEFISYEENFLIPIFNHKIDKLSFLNNYQKQELKRIHKHLIVNDFINAYIYLSNELEKLLGSSNHTGALANYPHGKEYYEALFQKATGTNFTIPEAKAYLEDLLETLLTNYNKEYIVYVTTYTYYDFMKNKKIDDLIPHFTSSMENDFPKLNLTIDYEIKKIHESMQENSAPAMYFISPIDDNKEEVIYINPLNFNNLSNYTYQTIAHEGYPGHLYQNVYLKNTSIPNVRKILFYPGYAEGWATYVENYVIKYGGGNQKTQEVFEFYDSINYLVLGLLDIGINYEGWDLKKAKAYLSNYFELTDDEVQEFYYDLIENPTNYLQYYFSYYILKDLKVAFRNHLQDEYSDLLFHTIYLETGPAPFHILEEIYLNYSP
ncbi:MAG TPA: DUF885 family protein [Bacilli bacterium]